ncbi:MAG TPA: STAS domain-containing protein [Gemmataceae bacterium]|nr:STAS domain-containing protein [Gemmataceae bacterium]
MAQHTLSRWFTVEQVGDVTVVRFAHASILADEAVDEVRQQLFEMVGEGRRSFVLSFARVTGLASRALGVLVGLHKKISTAGGRLVLCDVSPFLYQFFETAKLPGLLCFRGGVEGAVQSLTASA